ncbi:MAG TPA: recombinase family protein [Microvirga sp.]|jgi:DNA invertase Pin-like site-specific DNA recombinase|nr:recombinase family protein [Microvirga sp.]
MISKRTKDALAAAKARGVKLGGNRGNLPAVGDKGREMSRQIRIMKATDRVADLLPIIAEIRGSGATSLGRIAKALNERGIRTPRGAEWQPVQVKRVLERIAA